MRASRGLPIYEISVTYPKYLSPGWPILTACLITHDNRPALQISAPEIRQESLLLGLQKPSESTDPYLNIRGGRRGHSVDGRVTR